MKKIYKIGMGLMIVVLLTGCVKLQDNSTEIISTEMTSVESALESSVVIDKETEEISEEPESTEQLDISAETKDDESKWVKSVDAQFIEGYEIIEKEVKISFNDASFTRCCLPDGQLGEVLGEYDGMIYLEGFLDIHSGKQYVCCVSPDAGGEVEILFELEPYDYLFNVGMIENQFYFLYASYTNDGLWKVELYEYQLNGKYQILDTLVLSYTPHYWIVDHYLMLSIDKGNVCELWMYDIETGEKQLIKSTDIVMNTKYIYTGELILEGGAIDEKGFCYEVAYLENSSTFAATNYSIFYYDFVSGESKYLYSPQHLALTVRGDDRFVIRTETVYEEPLKNPTTFYDAKTGEWGRIAIPGVDLGNCTKNITKIEDGYYLFGNNKSLYVLDLDNRLITRYAVSVEGFPEEWITPGLTEEYLINTYLVEGEEQIVCIDCVNEYLFMKFSDIQELAK